MIQEVTKAAGATIEALKGSPALLVLVLLQVITMGMIYFSQQATQSRAQERELAVLERCFPIDRNKE